MDLADHGTVGIGMKQHRISDLLICVEIIFVDPGFHYYLVLSLLDGYLLTGGERRIKLHHYGFRRRFV